MKATKTVLFLFTLIGYVQPSMAQTDFLVVVNSANKTEAIDNRFLADVYLKRITLWDNNTVISPVDLLAESQVRKLFSDEILNRPVTAVRIYWQQLLFSGRGVPPPELKDDHEVIDFVASHKDAIGYVSKNADVHRLKIVQVKGINE